MVSLGGESPLFLDLKENGLAKNRHNGKPLKQFSFSFSKSVSSYSMSSNDVDKK